MTNLIMFNHEQFGEIRVLDNEGNPWFVASEICKILDVGNVSQALSRLDDEDRNTIILNEGIGNPEKSIVSESGLYSLVLGCRKPEAKAFKRWVTSEVLPSIRKHGAYLNPDKLEEVLTNPDLLIQLATTLKEERSKRQELELKVEQDKPKVLFADTIAVAETSILIGDFAKLISKGEKKIGQNRLFQWFRDNGYLSKRGDSWNSPTQRSVDGGWFELTESSVRNPDGSVRITKTTKITGKGQIYFANKLKEIENV